ncbi:MAG: hypothetical protein K2N91_01770, partial [Muribaculaceae bacterium]|nr:hypothetical protein [Muribaculaceae bacterium]
MRKLLLFIVLLTSIVVGRAETWTPVGQVEWVEGIVTKLSDDFQGKQWMVTIERSSDFPYIYRMQPYIDHPVSQKSTGGEYKNCKDPVYVYINT